MNEVFKDGSGEVDAQGRARRVSRLMGFYESEGITKEMWMDKTGYSSDQWSRWHSKNGTSPHYEQVIRSFKRMDMNPAHFWFGVGPARLSDLEDQLASLSEIEARLMKIKALLPGT